MRRVFATLAVAALAAGATAALLALPGSAAPGSGSPAAVKSSATKTQRVLTLRAAQRLANVALQACAKRGFPVTVSVVDRDGVEIAVLRDEDATGATVAVAKGKAFASAGFRTPTAALQEAAKTSPGLISVPGFVILPGGEPITIGKQLLGGVGVSGAPSGEIDDACAKAGLAAIS
jgi:uncharacterized protein GlcG (DUF336 family)